MGDQLGLDREERIWVQRTHRQLQIEDQQSLGNFSTRKLFIPQYDPIDLTVDEDEMDDMSRPSPQSLVDGNDSVISDSNGTISRKRSLDNMNDTEGSKGQEAKRRRMGESQRPTPSPTPEPMVMAEIVTTPVFNDAPKQLLLRSCALALDHIGFDGASKEAMESLWGEVDSYMTNLLSHVTESMLASRRTHPIPHDFEFAMRKEGLTSRLLKPHLKPPIPNSKTRLLLDGPPGPGPEELSPQVAPGLLGEELSGAADKLTKPYIPKNFPAFPSKHTYKTTPVVTEREKDPRKIREKATEAARHGEEALRRLVKVEKGDARVAKKANQKNSKLRGMQSLWEKTMEDFAGQLGSEVNGEIKKETEEEEQLVAVDADKRYWRKPVTKIKTTALH